MKNKNTQTKVYKQYLSKCVGGIARSYSVLQDKFATALQNNPDVKEFRLNVEVGKLPRKQNQKVFQLNYHDDKNYMRLK